MQVHKFVFNAFQENTYVVSDSSKNCVIIDPGCYDSHERRELFDFIAKHELKPLALLNTHGHIDHVMGNAAVVSEFQVPYYLHELDLPTMRAVAGYSHLYGFEGYVPSPEPTHLLEDGQELVFGEIRLRVIFGPGHAPGHVAFYSEEEKFVINGDILFRGSFGRTDLPGGDFNTLRHTIVHVMFKLPEDTVVYSGHGPETTIGFEKAHNAIYQF
jgi:glyoxylase-like metal-dependent hydrolase (beta-lactamase superfamily II)